MCTSMLELEEKTELKKHLSTNVIRNRTWSRYGILSLATTCPNSGLVASSVGRQACSLQMCSSNFPTWWAVFETKAASTTFQSAAVRLSGGSPKVSLVPGPQICFACTHTMTLQHLWRFEESCNWHHANGTYLVAEQRLQKRR